jgi:hypothetical protein
VSPILESIGSVKGFGWGALLSSSSYESIATATGTGSSNTITFSSIPSTYASLQVRAITKTTDAGSGFSAFDMRINSDSALNYPYHRLRGDGASVFAQGYDAANGSNGVYLAPVVTTGLTNIFGAMILDIHDYTSTTKNKTVRTFIGGDANGSGSVVLTSSVWLNTSAVTSLSFVSPAYNWATGTTFALYGIKGA